ncbi:MAG: metal-dependent hydrolase [Candidatus Woesearchaeota archaeon]
MFIGHFGIGFFAKKYAPKISLGWLFIASQFIDLLWPILLLFNVEKVAINNPVVGILTFNFISYPISHSLFMVFIWGILFGLIYWFFQKDKIGAIVLGLCVMSHWILDLIVHVPDLPLAPWDATKVGFGLWNYVIVSQIIEIAIFAFGIIIYMKYTKSKNNIGKYGLLGLVVLLFVIHLANIFGSAPPSVEIVAWAGNLQWIFVILAFWIDKNRINVKKSGKKIKNAEGGI